MIDIDKTIFQENQNPRGTLIRAKFSIYCEYLVFKELAIPEVITDTKMMMKRRIWAEIYGDCTDPFNQLETCVRRDMPEPSLQYALDRLAEIKKLLAYPK